VSFWEVRPPEGPHILSEQLSHKHLPTWWVSTLYVEQFKSFIFGEAILGRFPPQRAPKFCPNNCLTNNFLLCEFQLSMLSSSKKFYFWGVIFGGSRPGGPPNLVKIIVSLITFYIVSFKFLCWAVQKLRFERQFWEVRPPISPFRTLKFGQNNCLTYNILHCEFHLSMLSN